MIENNYVYSAFSTGVFGISMRDKNYVPGTVGTSTIDNGDTANPDLQPDRIRIRNNTVYLTAPNNSSWGIALNGNVGDALTGGSYELNSNIVWLGSSATATTGCFDTRNIVAAKFTSMDYNLCFWAGATAPKWDLSRSTLAVQQAAGFDTHSLTGDPLITTPASPDYSLAISTGSPAKNAGHPSKSSRLSYGGVLRDATPDIGAFEFGATGAVPASQYFQR